MTVEGLLQQSEHLMKARQTLEMIQDLERVLESVSSISILKKDPRAAITVSCPGRGPIMVDLTADMKKTIVKDVSIRLEKLREEFRRL